MLVAVLMLMSSFAALAAEDEAPAKTFDTPLTVTGLSQGDTANFYKIIEWVGETENDVGGWDVVSTYNSLRSEIIPAVLGTPEDPSTDEKEYVKPTGITSELAGKLARVANAEVVTGDISVKEGTEYQATLTNAEPGMWMAIVTPKDADTIYNPVFVSADYNTDEGGSVAVSDTYDGQKAVAKKSTVTLTKEFANSADYSGDNGQTTAVDDIVTFTVKTTIPGYAQIYENPVFKLHDKLTDLELQQANGNWDITVTGTGVTSDNYTIEDTTSASGYDITFKPAFLKTLTAALPITVVYTAKVTSSALKAINEEDNDVYIEYSHNPQDESDYDVKKDATQHYTFTIDAEGLTNYEAHAGKKTSELVKIGLDAAGNPITDTKVNSWITKDEYWEGPLKGAQFGLYKEDQVTLTDGKHTAIKANQTPYKTQTTGDDGRMTFAGLDEGTYYLKELQAPTGYVLQTAIHTVVLAAEVDKVTVTEWWNGSKWVAEQPSSGIAKKVTYETEILKSYTVTVDGEPTATYTFTNANTASSNEIKWEDAGLVEHPFELPNVKGTELPSTGGMGTTILYIGGSILVILAAVLLITKRRMNAED